MRSKMFPRTRRGKSRYKQLAGRYSNPMGLGTAPAIGRALAPTSPPAPGGFVRAKPKPGAPPAPGGYVTDRPAPKPPPLSNCVCVIKHADGRLTLSCDPDPEGIDGMDVTSFGECHILPNGLEECSFDFTTDDGVRKRLELPVCGGPDTPKVPKGVTIPIVPTPPPGVKPPECCVDASTTPATLQQCSDPSWNGTPVQIINVDPVAGTVFVVVRKNGYVGEITLPLCPDDTPQIPPNIRIPPPPQIPPPPPITTPCPPCPPCPPPITTPCPPCPPPTDCPPPPPCPPPTDCPPPGMPPYIPTPPPCEECPPCPPTPNVPYPPPPGGYNPPGCCGEPGSPPCGTTPPGSVPMIGGQIPDWCNH